MSLWIVRSYTGKMSGGLQRVVKAACGDVYLRATVISNRVLFCGCNNCQVQFHTQKPKYLGRPFLGFRTSVGLVLGLLGLRLGLDRIVI